eukprot:1157280-Pelagomonas_calceolata.AAC.3
MVNMSDNTDTSAEKLFISLINSSSVRKYNRRGKRAATWLVKLRRCAALFFIPTQPAWCETRQTILINMISVFIKVLTTRTSAAAEGKLRTLFLSALRTISRSVVSNMPCKGCWGRTIAQGNNVSRSSGEMRTLLRVSEGGARTHAIALPFTSPRPFLI